MALFALFFIAGLTKNVPVNKHRKGWIASSLVLVLLSICAFALYLRNTNRLTFSYPPGTENTRLYVGGSVLTQYAENWLTENRGETVVDLLFRCGGLPFREKVWTRESLGKAKELLTWNYVAWVVSLASSIFVLAEGLLGPSRTLRATQVQLRPKTG